MIGYFTENSSPFERGHPFISGCSCSAPLEHRRDTLKAVLYIGVGPQLSNCSFIMDLKSECTKEPVRGNTSLVGRVGHMSSGRRT